MENKKLLSLLYGFALLLVISVVLANFVGPIVVGIFMYYACLPLHRYINKTRIPDTLSAILSIIILFVPFTLLLFYTTFVLMTEISLFVSKLGLDSSDFLARLSSNLGLQNSLTDVYNNVSVSNILDSASSASSLVIDILSNLTGLFVSGLIASAICFYFLRDGEQLKQYTYDLVKYDKHITSYFNQLTEELETVFFGNILISIIISAVAASIYTVMSSYVPGGGILKYPALIGILCGATSIIPIIGIKVIYIPVTVRMAINPIFSGNLNELLFPASFLVVSFVFVDTIPDQVLRPYVSSSSTTPTSILLISYTVGPLFFGWYGVFLAPIVAVSFLVFLDIYPSIHNI
jgi:predicted PurR-regulated permease PerM